ncbi:MAG: hypothetical protein LUD22_01075 [Coprobacillus sp.]|nr:hypothetical protein [Coprobacillus sp.]
MAERLYYESDIDPLTDYPLLIRATFVALKNLDGEGEIHDLQKEVARLLDLSKEQIERKNNPSNPLSEFEYRTKIARTYLKIMARLLVLGISGQ